MLLEPPPKGLGIPVITILLEGGTDALYEVRDNLMHGQPCVVIAGSGRSADILAYAYKNTERDPVSGNYCIKEGHIRHMEELMHDCFADRLSGKLGKMRGKEFINWIMDCIRYSDLISVFDINRDENLDKTILSALLLGKDLTVQSQMYLSMIWNRVDIAEEKIFKNRSFTLKETDLYEVMNHSLILDRLDFVELLIMNGFSMYKFLTVKRLRELYNDGVVRHPHLLVQIKRRVGPCDYIYLNTIHKLLTFFMKTHTYSLYEMDKPPTKEAIQDVIENSLKKFDHPFFELFIWAVLCNRGSLREYFWSKSGSPLVASLFASTFYGVLIQLYKLSDTKEIRCLKESYMNKANSMMEIAYAKDLEKSLSLVEKTSERFNGKTLIQLSYTGNLKSFIANQPCQRVIRSTWQRGFWKMDTWAILLTIFIPIFVMHPTFIYTPFFGNQNEVRIWQRILRFYKAPIVKYTCNVISYVLFLLLYTSVALFNFEWKFQVAEIILYLWLLILILDEFIELFSQPYCGLVQKFKGHMSNVWNRFDLLICFVATLGFVLKNFQTTFPVSRVLFALNCSLLYCRLFRVYHASWTLGPKLVVFHRMISEIVTFMMLLIVFILGYGAASQALLNPHREFIISDMPQMISNIVYLPYWQMYGELNLESIVNENKTVCYEEDFCEDFTAYNHVTVFFLAI